MHPLIARMFGSSELLVDWLPWLLPVRPDVFLTRSGGLLRCALVEPPDLETASAEQLVAHHHQVAAVLARLGTGWSCWLDQWRVPAPGYLPGGSFNGNVAAQRIDAARAAQFADVSRPVFRNTPFISFHVEPKQRDALRSWLGGREEKTATANIRYFIDQTDELLAQLALTMRGVTVLQADDAISYLDATVGYKPGLRRMPSGVIAAQLAGHLWRTSPYLQINGQHVSTVEVWSWGSPTPLTAEALHELPFPARWCTTLHGLDPEDRRKELEEVRKGWLVRQKSVGAIMGEAFVTKNSLMTRTNPEADRALGELDAMLAMLHERPFGLAHCNVHVWGDTRGEAVERGQQVASLLNGQGLLAQLAELNATLAPLADIPGQRDPKAVNVRRARVEIGAVTRLAPVTGVNEGSREDRRFGGAALFSALSRRSVPIHFAYNAPGSDSAHTGMFGKTGSGKSALLAFMMGQTLRYDGARAIVFDRGRSFFVPCLCLGGDWYELGGGGTGVQPLRNIHHPEELAWAQGWVEMAMRRRGFHPTARSGESLTVALRHVASRPPDERTLSLLWAHLGGDAEARAALAHYLDGRGPYGKLFDGVVPGYGTANVIGVEMSTVMALPDGLLAVIAAFRELRFARLADGSTVPKVVAVDEFGRFLDDELFAAEAEGWARELRKLMAVLIVSTQQVSDLATGRGRVIFDQLANRIYMPHAEATRPQTREMYQRVGLSDDQINLIAHLRPKGDALFQTEQFTRAGTVRLEGDALRICGSSSPLDHRRARALLAAGVRPGPDFCEAWCAEATAEWAARQAAGMEEAA